MGRLDPLAAELRSQLGPAPDPTDAQWRRVQHDERLESPRGIERRHWLTAAAFGLITLTLWLLFLRAPFGKDSIELSASAAPIDHHLDDGSVLVLERQSRGLLQEGRQATTFRLETGKVSLEVAPQEGRAFEVRAAGYTVTVVGTRFDVSLATTGGVTVEVAHGVVAVAPPAGGSVVRLVAGDRLEGDGEGRVTVRRAAPASDAAAPSNETPPAAAAVLPEAPSSEAPAGASASNREASPPDWRASFQARRYPEALASARALGVSRLLEELDAGGLSDLADAARLGGDPSLGVRVLDTLRARFPGTARASRAAFLLGRAHALSGNQRDAIGAFEAHLVEDPNGAHSIEALGRLMELYAERGDRKRARSAAERYLERAPQGPYERLAHSLVRP